VSNSIDYYICLISPWTYLGSQRLINLGAKYNTPINFKPVALPQIMPGSGGLPLAKRAPQRQKYRFVELERWRTYLNIPLNLTPAFFPASEWPAAGMVIAASKISQDSAARLSHAILRAVWAEERNIADIDTLITIAKENGLDGAFLLAEAETDAVKSIYDSYTAEAIEKDVFGAPAYVFKDELYWGQDRLDFLERALAR
jgi:2-hydroxychromene-2-carboxylate isomerase